MNIMGDRLFLTIVVFYFGELFCAIVLNLTICLCAVHLGSINRR